MCSDIRPLEGTVRQSKGQLVYCNIVSTNVEVKIPLRTANEVGLSVGGVVALVASRGGIGFQFKQIVVAARFSFLLPANSDREGRDARRSFCVLRRAHARKCNESVKLDRVVATATADATATMAISDILAIAK